MATPSTNGHTANGVSRISQDLFDQQRPPGESRGMLAWLKKIGSAIGEFFSGPRGTKLPTDDYPGTPAGREVGREKAASGPRGITLPWFLPYFDDQHGETQAMRLAYRRMVAANAETKAALLNKILSVAGLELQIQPASESPHDVEVAQFVEWNLAKRLRGGIPGLVWSILSGGLMDGYSVCEKVWGPQTRGKYTGHNVLRALKPKDTGRDIVLLTDEYRNIVGVQGLRYNAGEIFTPSDFLIWQHLPMFGSPVGMSDLRAAYDSYVLLDTALKLRAVGLDKRAMPQLVGFYPWQNPTLQSTIEVALAKARSQSWLALPDNCRFEAINIAGMADAQFSAAVKDLAHRIFLAICGAILQALEGEVGSERGNSQVHKTTADRLVWFLQSCILQLLNDHETGLIRDIVDLNYVVDEYPEATAESVDVNEQQAELALDTGLHALGLDLDKDETYKRYGRTKPDHTQPENILKGAQGGGEQSGMGNLPGPSSLGFTEFGEFLEEFDDEIYHGPNPPGPGWVEVGTGPRGGKMWRKSGSARASVAIPSGFESAVKSLADDLIGGKHEEIGTLLGMPANSKITLSPTKDGKGLRVQAKGDGFDATRFIRRDADGNLYMKNEAIELTGDKQGSGFGSDVFEKQVKAAKAAGFKYIKCNADGGAKDPAKHIGYYVWPRLGYDQAISEITYPKDLQARIAQQFPQAKTVQDIMATPQGRAWWKENGASLENARFDLSDGSRSMKVFQEYMAERKNRKHSEFAEDEPDYASMSEEELEQFAAEDWTQKRGPRGGTYWENKAGRKVYGTENPGGKAKAAAAAKKPAPKPAAAKPAAKEKPAPKAAKPTVESTVAHAKEVLAKPTPEGVLKLVDNLLSLKKADMEQVRQQLGGGKGGRTKSELAKKIAEKVKATVEEKTKAVLADHGDVLKKLGQERQGFEEGKNDPRGYLSKPAPANIDKIEQAVSKVVKAHVDAKGVGPTIESVYDSVGKPMGLSMEQFHTALAHIWQQGREGQRPQSLKLGGWARGLDDHPRPDALMPIGGKHMGYIQPGEAAPADHGKLITDAVRKLDTRGANLVSMADLRDHLAQQGLADRAAQDKAINDLRRQGVLSLSGIEGRHALSDPAKHKREMDAAIREGDSALGGVSFRNPEAAKVQPSKPAEAQPAEKPKKEEPATTDNSKGEHSASAPFKPDSVSDIARAFEFAQDRKAQQSTLGGGGISYLPELHYRLEKATGSKVSPEQFKAIMTHLQQSRAVELHILNEVRMMKPEEKKYVPERGQEGAEQSYAFCIIKDHAKLASELTKIADGEVDLSKKEQKQEVEKPDLPKVKKVSKEDATKQILGVAGKSGRTKAEVEDAVKSLADLKTDDLHSLMDRLGMDPSNKSRFELNNRKAIREHLLSLGK